MIPLRFIGSFLFALVVVFSMLVGGLAAFGVFDEDERNQKVHPVALLSRIERIDLAEELGEDHSRRLPDLPPARPKPKFELPRRATTGFVEVQVSVAPDGSVTDLRVLSNTHDGVYEEEAKTLVRARGFEPDVVDGRAVPTTRIEIVDYSVPAEPE